MIIADICHRSACTVRADSELLEAAQLMRAQHVGFLVVVQPDPDNGANRVVGMLTDLDIVVGVLARGVDLCAVRVSDIMVRDPVTVSQTEPVTQAIAKMRRIGVRRLPVLGQLDRLIGVVSLDDILVALASASGDPSKVRGNEIMAEERLRPA